MSGKQFAIWIGAVLSLAGVVCAADQMPKSGSFTVHSGWKSIGEMTPAADGRMYGNGSFWGIAYNDKGAGPLHSGPVICPYTLETIQGAGTAQGHCAWSDRDGDKIFTDWTSQLAASGALEGMNKITGGTGKYSGIQGKAPFQCQALNANGQWVCTQQFEYRLTSK